MPASADREDHHAPVRLLALRLAPQPGERDSIVDDLPLERGHGPQLLRLARLRYLLGHRTAKFGKLGAASRTKAADVKHEPGAGAGLPVYRQTGKLLQRLKHLAVVADQLIERGTDDGHDGPVAFHVHIDVAV